MAKEKEIRKVFIDNIETRSIDGDVPVIEGYINKFNERSQKLRAGRDEFYEYVDPKAFDKSLNGERNIYALYNHDSSKILGSTRSGSLSLEADEVGLRFSLKPNTKVSYANDVLELIRSGDLSGASFGFSVNEDDWEDWEGERNTYKRTLRDVTLHEVTLTGFPAYESSEVHSRSLDEYKAKIEEDKSKELRALKQKQIAIELELL